MGGAAVRIDVQSVRLVVHHMCLRSQGVKYVFGNGGRASVGTVQGHLHILEGTGSYGYKVSDIAVPSGRKVHGPANMLPLCQRNLRRLPIQVLLYLQDDGLF